MITSRKIQDLFRNPSSEHTLWLCTGLFLLALFVRILFGLFIVEVDRPMTGDEGGFHWRAMQLLEGNWGERAHRAPFTGIVMSIAYRLFGGEVVIGRWTLVTMSSFGAPLLFLLARNVSRSAAIGLVCSLYWVLYPPSIFYSTLLYTETLSAILLILSLTTYWYAAKRKNIVIATVTGLVWGCLVLNRATFLLMPVAFVLFSLFFRSSLSAETKLLVRQWVFVVLGFTVALTPWTIHTYHLYDTFMPHNTRGGWALLMSNGNLDDPMVKEGGYSREPEYAFDHINPRPNAFELDNLQRKMAIRLIGSHLKNRPLDYLNVVIKRVRNFWSWRPDPYDSKWTRNDWIMLIFWAPVLVATVFSPGLWEWRKSWPVIVVIGYLFAISLPFWGTPRFRYPVDPLMVVLASWSMVYWAKRLLTSRRRGFYG